MPGEENAAEHELRVRCVNDPRERLESEKRTREVMDWPMQTTMNNALRSLDREASESVRWRATCQDKNKQLMSLHSAPKAAHESLKLCRRL